MMIGKKDFSSKIGVKFQFISKLQKDCSMIETRRLKNVVIFSLKIVFSFQFFSKSRKIK